MKKISTVLERNTNATVSIDNIALVFVAYFSRGTLWASAAPPFLPESKRVGARNLDLCGCRSPNDLTRRQDRVPSAIAGAWLW